MGAKFYPGGERPLTRRQAEVLGLLKKGLPNKSIAEVLGIGAATVKQHVHAILSKGGFRNRTDAAVRG